MKSTKLKQSGQVNKIKSMKSIELIKSNQIACSFRRNIYYLQFPKHGKDEFP